MPSGAPRGSGAPAARRPPSTRIPSIARRLPCALGLAALLAPSVASAQLRYDREYPSIHYSDGQPDDPVARLLRRVREGEAVLRHEGARGYLADLLAGLDIPIESQVLVFTRTSFQANRVSPEKPRAIYFNDDAYVAWVQDGDVIEISGIDPVMGGVFYTLGQDPGAPASFTRETDLCLQCHDSYGLTGGGVPRHLVGSMLPDGNGQSVYHEGWQLTDDRTPLARRWGGWYVTGTHGRLIHRGNVIVEAPATPGDIDFSTTGNRPSLAGLVDTGPYLSGGSDIVALLVLEHQVRVQNAITRLGYDVRTALHRDEVEGRAPAAGERRASVETLGVLERSGQPLVDALLFADEATLGDRIEGTSGYAEAFERRGPRDALGRTLRALDLRDRLFHYPVSYMVHGRGFAGLPEEAKRWVADRILAALTGDDEAAHPGRHDDAGRAAALEILRDTEPELFGAR